MSFLKNLFNSDNTATAERDGADGIQLCSEFIEMVLRKMDEICDVEVKYDSSTNTYSALIIGGDAGRIIGRKGETLDAIRYLATVALNRAQADEEGVRVELDIEGYAKKRREAIVFMVKAAANKMKKTGRNIELEAMSSYDRRIAHETANELGVKSVSVGTGSARRVLICKE
jgi:spoIIIJ-associated protein